MNRIGTGNYHVEFNRVIAAAEKRFREKERSFSGWNQTEWKGNMASRAYAKLRKLANGKCEDPLKEAADVMNFCVFFFVQHPDKED